MPQPKFHPPCTRVFVALGANLPSHEGPPAATLRTAMGRLDAEFDGHTARSALYATPCHPPGAGPDYVNAVIELASRRAPADLLTVLHGIEAALDRTRDTRWAARCIDLDLLAVGDAVLPDLAGYRTWHDLPPARQQTETPDWLILPHPRLHERAFVLVPLAEIAPDWCHPVLRRTAADLCAALPAAARQAIRRLE